MRFRTIFLRGLIFPMAFSVMVSLQTAKAEEGLRKTESIPMVDGVIKPGEYSFSIEVKQMTLFLSRTSDRLYAALTAETEGWIGIGFKSKVMNNAEVVLGYVKDGKGYIHQQFVKGRSHTDKKLPYVKSSAISESSKTTVVEVELLAHDLIEPGQKVLPLILAFGTDDSITKYHKQRAGLEIKLID